MTECGNCPRKCKVNRAYEAGYCGCTDTLTAARAGLHYFEEPFISGTRGSGTVFFTGCNLGCVYCQNYSISGTQKGRFGAEISTGRLAEIFLELQKKGAENINLVTGTPYIHQISEALKLVKGKELMIPVLWNSSAYEETEALKSLEGLVDIWLPDFKTCSKELAARYMKAPDYPEKAMKAIEWMVKAAGEPVIVYPESGELSAENDSENTGEMTDFMAKSAQCRYSEEDIAESGLMKSGVCVRHLMIPGQLEDTKKVLKYLYETFGDKIWISLMSQYTPVRDDFIYPELNRKLTEEEYDEAVDYAADLGIEQCMIQGGDVAEESFIPDFDGKGINF